MDVTTVNLGSETRDALRDYKQQRGHASYNEAVRELLEKHEEYP